MKQSKELNILIAVPNDALGGAEQFLKQIAKYYQSQSANVYVVFIKSNKFKGWDDISGLPGLNLVFGEVDSELKGFLKFSYTLRKISNKVTLDYIFSSHVHITGLIGILMRTRVLKTSYFIGRESTSIFKRFTGIKLAVFKSLYRLGYSELNLLICQTDFMKTQLVESMPRLEKTISIQVFPNPIALNEIKSVDVTSQQIYEKNFIVAAGRLIQLKGFHLLIEAFSRLEQKDLSLIILGDGPERNNLSELANKLKVKDKVILHGWTDNVYPYFKDAEVCIVSSLIEGFPNVLLQMMSQNTNVICTKCAGGIEKIPGIISCETNSVLELQKAIETALIQNIAENREKFDVFLEERTIERFIEKLESYVSH